MTLKAFAHQKIGVEELVKWDDPENGRIHGGCFALFDEMGVGKTKQVIDAAQILYEKGEINKVVVVAPVAVRSVWFDKELGELKKHLYVNSRIIEYHKKIRSWDNNGGEDFLFWMVTNYDYIRQPNRLKPLLESCDEKTFLVLDESSAIKNRSAKQTRACMELRKVCGRVVLLNGTPIANSPNDMFSQGEIMDPGILDVNSNYYRFRSKYAVMGGYRSQRVTQWIQIEDMQNRFKPYVLRRLKSECLDLPKKMDPIALSIPLTEKSWKRYKNMRDDMVAWLETASEKIVTATEFFLGEVDHDAPVREASMAQQAMVKAIRLAQLTSGFLGGLEDPNCKEVSREKMDFFLKWFEERKREEHNPKILVWCRFRLEVFRMVRELDNGGENYVGRISGGQKPEDRERSIALLDPRTTPNDKSVIIIGNPMSGGMGLNLAASHLVYYSSNDYNLKIRLQSEDRVHRPGQEHPVSYYDAMAVGPDGQKTIDHSILKAIREKEKIANWTTQAWIRELQEE